MVGGVMHVIWIFLFYLYVYLCWFALEMRVRLYTPSQYLCQRVRFDTLIHRSTVYIYIRDSMRWRLKAESNEKED